VSWDLYLVPRDAAGNPSEWLEAHDEQGQNAVLARKHADVIIKRRPDLHLGGPFGESYQLTPPEESELPLDIGLYGNHASISVPYWDLEERTTELAELVVDVATTLATETGWVLYDPQEDRIVETNELGALFGSGQAHGVSAIERLGAASEQAPKKKRRFGVF